MLAVVDIDRAEDVRIAGARVYQRRSGQPVWSMHACRRRGRGHRARIVSAMADLKTEQILALLAPIILIQLGLMVVALLDLEKEDRRVRGGNKLVWILVIVFLNVIGPIVYFVAGRDES